MVDFEKVDFVVLKIFDLLGHSLDSLLELKVLDFKEVSFFTILLLETVGDLVILLGR